MTIPEPVSEVLKQIQQQGRMESFKPEKSVLASSVNTFSSGQSLFNFQNRPWNPPFLARCAVSRGNLELCVADAGFDSLLCEIDSDFGADVTALRDEEPLRHSV